ncbi:hypothetical protein [uncultured Cohaesibacter sp.]|uniref:hypothetical protein n=1 Tax=uncultured Cohaesibacter sp. TaxID=1002546 RepID=UPI0029C7CDA7|nr:hypothetical protein [uncultured Cohaesibacter sp.]
MIPSVKTFIAVGALVHRQLVAFTANDGEVTGATGDTDVLAGVVDFPSGAADGERVDVVIFGPAEVICGGDITPGAAFTSDANGAAVAAAPVAGANAYTVGMLLANAASGDYARAFVQRGSMTGAA